MTVAVKAPEGYEAQRYFNVDTREWVAAFRRVGETWWTVAGYIGHAHLQPDELDSRATAQVERWLTAHKKV
jgi:hypothetical protein